MPRITDTRPRMIRTAARLMRRQGYAATGWRQLVADSATPWGPQFHHFPRRNEPPTPHALTLPAHPAHRKPTPLRTGGQRTPRHPPGQDPGPQATGNPPNPANPHPPPRAGAIAGLLNADAQADSRGPPEWLAVLLASAVSR